MNPPPPDEFPHAPRRRQGPLVAVVAVVSLATVVGASLFTYDRLTFGPPPWGGSCSPADGYAKEFAPPGDLSAPDARSTSTLVHTPDSMALATAMEDGTTLWDSESGEPVAHVPIDTGLSSPAPVAFHPSGCLMAVGTLDGAVVFDLTDGQREAVAEGVAAPAVRFSPDGSTLAVGVDSDPEDRHLHLYSTRNWERTGALEGARSIGAIAFSEDGSVVSGGEIDGGVAVWETDGGTLRTLIRTRGGDGASAFALFPDGKRLAIVLGNKVSVHDTSDGKVERSLRSRNTDGTLMDVAYSREHDLVLASRTGGDGRAEFLVAWEPDTGEEFWPEGPSTAGPEVHPFTLSDDGTLLTGVRSEDGAVAVYEIDPELGYFPTVVLGGRG